MLTVVVVVVVVVMLTVVDSCQCLCCVSHVILQISHNFQSNERSRLILAF